MEETGKVLNVLRQIHTVDNSEEDICEQEQVSQKTASQSVYRCTHLTNQRVN